MSTQNKQIARRMYEEGFNKGDYNSVAQVLAPDHCSHDPHNPPGYKVGPDGMKEIIRHYRAAFPDLHFTIDEQMAEGDRVITRWTSRGTHRGQLMELAPTGKSTMVTGISIDRIENGKIAETWVSWDMAGLMQQLTGRQERPRTDGGRVSQPMNR